MPKIIGNITNASNYKTYKNCVWCCLKLLIKYNLFTDAYDNSSLTFNYQLTL